MNVTALVLAVAALGGVVVIRRVRRDTLFTLSLALIVILIATSMVLYPEPSFKAAERGLGVWWEVVLPALLPFFIAAELLMGMGVVHFMAVLCQPIMRPVFNVPGSGSFTMAMGIASGYPLGAALSARLKDTGLATKTEAERLMCFCNTSDPLFMTGAVAVGMFRRADVAAAIVTAHYISAVLVGLAMRFWKMREKPSPLLQSDGSFILLRAYRAMRDAQREKPQPFGKLMGEAVNRSVNTLMAVLGFMVLFSVIFELLRIAGATEVISQAITRVIPDSLIPKALHEPLVSGFFEITIGTSMASQAAAPLVARVAACSAIIAWSGLSVLAQVAAVTQPSGLSVLPYAFARFFQGIMAAILTVLIMKPGAVRWSLPTFEPYTAEGSLVWLENMGLAAKSCVVSVLAVAVVSLIGLALYETVRRKKA
ncbi:MAG: sporulation integral membrane protein YlbJ [Bacillota bacterium]|jgi:sporulation integral membrane protein YlbJ|nr:sporulation integral membrane protein YlbJ [Candidatus Fermentithermobacillaceae bacterium]